MSKETKDIQSTEANTQHEDVRSDWKALLKMFSYTKLVDSVPFLSFVAALCVGYIAYNKSAVETQRSLNLMNDTLKELHWEYMDAKSQMMSAQMEIEVMKKSAALGLKPMMVPAFSLVTDTTTHNTTVN